MTATAQFSRPIIVGIVSLAAVVRFLTSLARRKEIKSALMNQRGSYRKLLVKRRMVEAMADILIRGMEMPKGCAECKLNSDTICVLINGCIYDESNGSNRRQDCPLYELPEHGDLISKDDAMNAILGEPPEAHYPSWYASIVNEIPAIVPSNKEGTE